MLFNSIDFAIFLPIVFALYWFVVNKNLKLQNFLIFAVSYVFYGWWDWRFLSLILFSTVVDYAVGLALAEEKRQKIRKMLLGASLFINLGFLGVFKYYNFFLDNFIEAFTFLGMPIQANGLNIILPVGISFYTFQTLSYTIDIYKKQLKPTRDFIAFGAFVSFFPQLVAGPIERASNLLPQFYKKRTFDFERGLHGSLQIFWGLFKKIVIADNLAFYINAVYGNAEAFTGFPLIWATLFFTFQIYCDFSGYSSIAIGTAKLFGFDLMVNFRRPYFSQGFQEFWSRWHISLSTWFKDYVYIPLGGNRNGATRASFNVFITFLVSGFWHGANWTFLVWGAIHGFLNTLSRSKKGSKIPTFVKIAVVFFITMLTWVFFRAENISDAIYILANMFNLGEGGIIGLATITKASFLKLLLLVLTLVGIDFGIEMHKRKAFFTAEFFTLPMVKVAYCIALVVMIYTLGAFEEQEFIYFQF